jgi:MFS family permease
MTEVRWSDLLTWAMLPRVVLVCFGIWLNAADSLVTVTIMPSVVRAIGGYAYFAWPVAAYLLGSIMGGATAGYFAHTRGLRAALMAASVPYILGCAMSAVTHSMAMFLIGRLLQGLAAGAIVGLCYVATSMLFPPTHYRRVMAALSAVWGIATLLGPLLGGIFAKGMDWQILFWMFAAQGLIFAAAIVALVPNAEVSGETGIPARTLALLTVAVIANLVAGVAGNLALSAALVATTIVFLFLALRADASGKTHLFPRGVADPRNLAGQGYIAIFLLNASAIGYGLYGAAILQTAYGLSPLLAGYAVGAEAMGWTITALVVAELPYTSEAFWIRAGATVAVAGIASMIFTLPSGILAAVIVSALLLGGGFGMFWAFLTRRIQQLLPPSEKTLGASAIPGVQMLSNAVGAALCGLEANTLGVGHGFTRANVLAAAMWLFVCAVPATSAGWFFAWRIGGAQMPENATSPSR